jgi:FlaA1/EpsC-like NDP-sugar epimerase
MFMQWLRARRSLFLLLPDAVLVLAALPAAHALVGGPSVFSASGSGPLLLLSALYLGAAAAGGRYHRPAAVPARTALALAGAAGLAGLGSVMAPSVVSVPLRVVLLHAALAAGALVGLRTGLAWLQPTAPSATPPPSSVALSDLVPREPVAIDRPGLRHFLADRTVLVTGAGGSIGAELSAQLTRLSPDRLVLVDVSEQNLHHLETTLRTQTPETDLVYALADVRDEARMEALLHREQPDAVLHTAAYKHVHLMERHPQEAFQNNTMATVRLLRLCEQTGVDQFVFVSTDKAVAPESVLGATKRWAEWYVRTACPSLQARTVRFGNVFGSDGSVVPRFLSRVAEGRPLPITHPDMERYFMTAEEACQLILQTLLLDAHPTYILKMGDPVRIEWLAKQLIDRWHPDAAPEEMIEYVGRRPGEKLSEQLVCEDESVHKTDYPSILGLEAAPRYPREALDGHFQEVQAAATAELRRLLLRAEPASSPSVA